MNKLAITGIDVVFADVDGIDQFERALYRANAIAPCSFSERKISVLLSDCVDRLLLQTSVKQQDLLVIVIADGNTVELKQSVGVKAVSFVTDIAEALSIANQQTDDITVAIISFNLEEKLSSNVQQAQSHSEQ